MKVLGFVLFPLARARELDKSLLFFTVTSVTLLWQGIDFQMVKMLFSKCYGFNARNVEDGAKRGLWSVRFLPTFCGECPTFCRKSGLTSTKGECCGGKEGCDSKRRLDFVEKK